MKKIRILMILVFSLSTLGIFAQQKKIIKKTQKIKIQTKKKHDVKDVKINQEFPEMKLILKQDSLKIIQSGEISQEDLKTQIERLKIKKDSVKIEYKKIKVRLVRLNMIIRILERKLARTQGEEVQNNEVERELTEEEKEDRRLRHAALVRAGVRANRLAKAKDYDELERIVVLDGPKIKFTGNSKKINSRDESIFEFLIDAVKINEHARLIIGVKKKSGGLANSRVKYLKSYLVSKGLLPKNFKVIKLDKKAKDKYWTSQNNHMWMRLERM